MRFMVENVSAGPNINRTRRFLVECPEAGAKLLTILKDAIVRHLVEQIAAGAQVMMLLVCASLQFAVFFKLVIGQHVYGQGQGS